MAEPFPESVTKQAFDNAEGRCGKCGKELYWGSRGKESKMGWEAHHINRNRPPTVSNCKILCQDCHKATPTYGAS